MATNLLVAVMGNRNSGKTTTWNHLFESTVRTGRELRRLPISETEYVEVLQFLVDPQHRAVFAPAVMRQVLTRILIIERDTGDEEDESDWRQRWTRFASQLQGVGEYPGIVERDNGNLTAVEDWIDLSVESFVARAGLFALFAPPTSTGANP